MTAAALRSRLVDLVRQWTPRPPGLPEEPPSDGLVDAGRVLTDDGAPTGPEGPPPSAPASAAAGDATTPVALSWWSHLMPSALSGARVRALGLGMAALLLIVGWWWWQGRPQPVASPAQVVSAGSLTVGAAAADAVPGGSSPAGIGGGALIVHVTGPVRHPGIVTVPIGSRVIDAIEAAGGLRRGADYGTVNLARPLIDGEQIVVGSEGGSGSSGATPARLSLNQATAADLEDLPGVGPVLAARIIEWRDRNGGFRSIEELREVSGIGDATFADLSPLLTAP